MSVLPGVKTYSVAIISALGAFAIHAGWVTAEQWAHISPILLAAGLWFARLATSQVEKQL